MADVVIAHYGMGNIGSLRNMLLKVGASVDVSDDPDVVLKARRVILPGVGAFDEAVRSLQRTGLGEALVARSKAGTGPLLGVCLGMQLLMQGSEEGVEPGLGLLKGHCVRFPNVAQGRPLRVPHMGWSEVVMRASNDLARGMEDESRYYFVHSYHVPEDVEDVLATADYGVPFAAGVGRSDVLGLQFHPEKSHRHGMRLLADFAAA